MNREQQIAMRATRDYVAKRLAAVKPGSHSVTFPASEVHEHVTVDTAPIADVLDRFAAEQNKMLLSLAERPAPTMPAIPDFPPWPEPKPLDLSPLIAVTQQLAAVAELLATVIKELRKPAAKKEATIKHSDGTEATITLR